MKKDSQQAQKARLPDRRAIGSLDHVGDWQLASHENQGLHYCHQSWSVTERDRFGEMEIVDLLNTI